MEYLIANCLLACSVGGLIWIIKSDDFHEFKAIFKLRLLGKGLCEISKNGRLLYSYSDHISDYSAGLIGRPLNEWLKDQASKTAAP